MDYMDDAFFTEYELDYLDEDEGTTKTAHGITIGNDYKEVIEHLENYYGKDNIVEIKCLFMTDNTECYDFGDTHNPNLHGKYYINFKKWDNI